jgi:hypothetical protein
MRRRAGLWVALGAGLAVLGVFAGCGDEEKFSDGKISDAAKIEDDFVGGDPFCEVVAILNDSAEIDSASDRKQAAIITSSQGNVGVEVVLPFPRDCEETVRKGLNKLDPKPKE